MLAWGNFPLNFLARGGAVAVRVWLKTPQLPRNFHCCHGDYLPTRPTQIYLDYGLASAAYL